MTRPSPYLTTLTTLVLMSASPTARAQSSTNGTASADDSTSECPELRGLTSRLTGELAKCSSTVAERDGQVAELRRQGRADAAVIAGLRVELEEERVLRRSQPSPLRVTGWTLAAGCVATLATAGARWALTDTLDVWLLAVGGVQCVGGGLALTWGE